MSNLKEQRLEDHLYESREKLRDLQNSTQNNTNNGDEGKPVLNTSDTVPHSKLEDLKRDLEEQREVANNRLVELEQLNKDHKVYHFFYISSKHLITFNYFCIIGDLKIGGKV